MPPDIRVLFARVSVTGAAVWATAALFLSVVPSYAADLLDTSDLALLGAISATLLTVSCAAQIAARRWGAHARMQAVGLVLLALGLLALVLAFPARSLALLLVAGLLTGAGHGIAFLGAQAQLNLAAPPDRRGEVNAAFYTLIYLGVATTVISTGLVTLVAPLSTAITSFAVVTGASLSRPCAATGVLVGTRSNRNGTGQWTHSPWRDREPLMRRELRHDGNAS